MSQEILKIEDLTVLWVY